MPFHTVEEYQNGLEVEIKSLLMAEKAYLIPPMVMHPVALEEMGTTPSIVQLLTEKLMQQALISHVLLMACNAIISQYASEKSEGIFSELAEEIKEKLDIKPFINTEERVQQRTVHRLILMLESGVLSQEFNPTANYANLCRAIVNMSSNMNGWYFSHAFKQALALEQTKRIPSFHGPILDLGVKLGYFKEEQGGACRGLVMAWLSSCMAHEEERYAKLISEIIYEGSAFPETLSKAREKVGRHENLTLGEEHIFQTLALYDEVTLYLRPRNYHRLFKARLNQKDIEPISKLTSSRTIEAQGGLTEVASFSGCYTKEELISYVQYVERSIASSGYISGEIIGLIFGSHNHSIGLTHDTASGFWKVFDINQNEPRAFSQKCTEQMVEMVLDGFNIAPRLPIRPVFTSIYIQIITTGADPYQSRFQHSLTTFKESFAVSSDMARRRGIVNMAWIAAAQGDVTTLSTIAIHDDEINVTDTKGATPVFMAAQNGHDKAIFVLAANGADMNQPYENGATPALIAAQNGHDKAISVLSANGANLDTPDEDGETPALKAAKNGHHKTLALLSSLGANLNIPNKNGSTPAFIAAQYGHHKALGVLAKLGANLNIPNRDGTTPVFVATQNGHYKALAILATNSADLDFPCNDGRTPVFMAAQQGNVKELALLEEKGANLNTPDKYGATPSFIAAQEGNDKALAFLAEHGADINAPDEDGATPAFIAAQNGHYKALEILAANRADLNIPYGDGRTPAFMAAQQGQDKTLEVLSKHGANLNTPFIASSISLKEFAESYTFEIARRMNGLISKKLTEGEDERNISISPEEISYVMGHENVMKFFAALRAKRKVYPSFSKKSILFFNELDEAVRAATYGTRGIDF